MMIVITDVYATHRCVKVTPLWWMWRIKCRAPVHLFIGMVCINVKRPGWTVFHRSRSVRFRHRPHSGMSSMRLRPERNSIIRIQVSKESRSINDWQINYWNWSFNSRPSQSQRSFWCIDHSWATWKWSQRAFIRFRSSRAHNSGRRLDARTRWDFDARPTVQRRYFAH